MKSAPSGIVIIGTGLAGYLTAKEFRKYDETTPITLITKSDGHFYSKPLLSTALTNHKTPNQLVVSDVDVMRQQLHATIFTHCDVFQIDSENKKILYRDDKNEVHILEYEKLVLANGAEKINIPLEGDALDDVLFVNQLEDYRIFREQLIAKNDVAILGAGLIASEFANDLMNAGCKVKLIAPDIHPLSTRVPEMIGSALENVFRQSGIEFYGTVFPKKINRKNDALVVGLSDGTEVIAKIILSAVGIKPDLALAKTANIKINKGVVVNASLQTSDPAIFAIGECAEVNGQLTMHIAPIILCAHVLGKMLAGNVQAVRFPVMPIVIKTPACPIVIVAPPKNSVGEWKLISVKNTNIEMVFYDHDQHVKGFALSGDAVKEKNRLVRICEL